MKPRRWLGAALAAVLVFSGACGDDDDDASTATTGGSNTTVGAELSADEEAVQATVLASFKAENAKDADAFLAVWTDKGLEAYDQGSRAEIAAGDHDLGEVGEPTFAETVVTGDTAEVTADVPVEVGLFRVKFLLIRQGEEWLLDGFEFLGSPPPGPDTTVVDVKAVDYGFDFEADDASSGDFAIKFDNTGKEAHEISFFKLPDDASLGDAKTALEGVDGSELDPASVPEGYEVVGHLAFAEPGESVDFAFIEPLDDGHYAFVCYIPQGGFDAETGEPVDPNGTPHISLGMIADFTVG